MTRFALRFAVALLSALLVSSICNVASAAVVGAITDPLTGSSINPATWTAVNQGLEFTGPAGYNAPVESPSGLSLSGTTNHSFWAGSSLETVNSLSTNYAATVSVDRLSLSGSGSAYRSSLWLVAANGDYIHFAQDVGESNWQINTSGAEAGSPPAQGTGTSIAAFNTPALNTLGSHEMSLVVTPEGGTKVSIEPILDGVGGPSYIFDDFSTSFQAMLTGQARASGDTVNAVFENFSAVSAVPEPSTIVGLIGLVGMGLGALVWPRKGLRRAG
jgi:hypothetical protein